MEDVKTEAFWLMQGDCIKRLQEIPNESVDVVLSDIPYGIDFLHGM